MNKKENTEVTKVDPIQVPAFIGSAALGKGFEDDTDSQDFLIPRCQLCQLTSEAVLAENPEDRVEPGKIINSITRKELSPFFIAVFRFKSFCKWNPMDKHTSGFDPAYDAGELVFSTTDKNDSRIGNGLEFGEDGQPPVVTEIWNYLAMFPGESMPLIISFKRTSIRAARQLNTMMNILGGNMYDGKYKLVSCAHQEGQRKWYTLDVKGAGLTTHEERKIADSMFEHFRSKGSKVAQVVEEHAAPEEVKADAAWAS